MIRSLALLFVFLMFIGMGFAAPFVCTLGYVWVDTFRPQAVAYIILNQIPVALVMGCAALGTYLAIDRKSPPQFTLITGLVIALGLWVTATLLWAEVPDAALLKWNWAFKTIMFSAFIPFVIRSRAQIEAFIQVFLFALGANMIPFGIKVLLSGGGYGRTLGLAIGDSGLGEGSTLAAVAVMTIPLSMYLYKNAILVPKAFPIRAVYIGMTVAAILTTIGTYERTGLVGLAVLAIYMFMQSRRKVLFSVCVAVVAALIILKTSSAWNARIATIEDPTADTSALTRLLVWQWTFDYSLTHPFGGGFETYRIDRLLYPSGDMEFGRAFHSIYFEVLGEQGWVGLALFLGIAGSSYMVLRRARRIARKIEGLGWCADLAATLQMALVVMMTCGAFIGIGFQPWLYYIFALSVSVSQYVRRVVTPKPVPAYLSNYAQRSAAMGMGLAVSGGARQAEPSAAGARRASSLRTAWRPGTSR